MTEWIPVRIRRDLDGLAVFHPPARPVAVVGLSFLLDSNEASYGPIESVRRIIASAAGGVNLYPDNGNVELTDLLADWHRVTPEQVVVGPGSIGLLSAALAAVCEPGTEVVFGWPSFEAFPLLARLVGARVNAVALVDDRHDLPAMAARIEAHTRAVLVCNPNNPTGTVVSSSALKDFLVSVPPTCLVVLDEAYWDYADEPDRSDGVELCSSHPNLLVTRTFSKAHGLAGLRVGYAVGHPAVVRAVRNAQLPFAVNHLAEIAAAASLRGSDEVRECVRGVRTERDRLRRTLTELGFAVPESGGNFLWLRLGPETAAFAAACARAGIAVRTFDGEGVRVTIGEQAAIRRFGSVAEFFASAAAIR